MRTEPEVDARVATGEARCSGSAGERWAAAGARKRKTLAFLRHFRNNSGAQTRAGARGTVPAWRRFLSAAPRPRGGASGPCWAGAERATVATERPAAPRSQHWQLCGATEETFLSFFTAVVLGVGATV